MRRQEPRYLRGQIRPGHDFAVVDARGLAESGRPRRDFPDEALEWLVGRGLALESGG